MDADRHTWGRNAETRNLLSLNRSAGLPPAYDPHQDCGTQLKVKVNFGANVQNRSQTGAPVAFMAEIYPGSSGYIRAHPGKKDKKFYE